MTDREMKKLCNASASDEIARNIFAWVMATTILALMAIAIVVGYRGG